MDNIVAYAVAYAITYARLLDKDGYDRNWIRFHLFFFEPMGDNENDNKSDL